MVIPRLAFLAVLKDGVICDVFLKNFVTVWAGAGEEVGAPTNTFMGVPELPSVDIEVEVEVEVSSCAARAACGSPTSTGGHRKGCRNNQGHPVINWGKKVPT